MKGGQWWRFQYARKGVLKGSKRMDTFRIILRILYKLCRKRRETPQTHPPREMSETEWELPSKTDDIWNVNRCKAVIVSFYEGICSFHDDFPPHASSHTLLWHRIDVTSWNSTKSGNQTKMDVSTRGKLPSPLRSKGYGGVSQCSENDAWSEMDKRCLGTGALSAVRRWYCVADLPGIYVLAGGQVWG